MKIKNIVLIILILLGGLSAVAIAFILYQKRLQPITPTAPPPAPAISEQINPRCEVNFLVPSPTPTPTPTITPTPIPGATATLTATPTLTPTPTPTVTPTLYPTPTSTPTPTPTPTTILTPTATPTPIPGVTTPPTPTATLTPTPTQVIVYQLESPTPTAIPAAGNQAGLTFVLLSALTIFLLGLLIIF